MTVRKEAKARWVYTCEPCNERVEAIDQFRATEYGQWHEKGPEHALAMAGQVFQGVIDAFAKIVGPALDAMSSIAKAFETPGNLPHDPRIRNDRRKWGGR